MYPPPKPIAILLDMDGTLTVPRLDFAAIKRDMGIGSMSILEALDTLSGERKAQAVAVLDRHEQLAAEESELAAGAVELLDELAARRIPTALVTRNSLACVRIVVEKHRLPLPVVVARDCSQPKPHPSAAATAMARLGMALPPEPAGRAQVWMVGDGEFDIQLAHATGMTGIWLSLGRQRDFAEAPHTTVESLYDLIALLRQAHTGLTT